MTGGLKIAGLRVLDLPDEKASGICEIDPLTGLMVCDLPAAKPTDKTDAKDAAPASKAGRPTGETK